MVDHNRAKRSERALVTGATGFVGRQLVALLQESGWDAIALERSRGRRFASRQPRPVDAFAISDAREVADVLDRAEVDTVFHLAAHHSRGDGPDDADAFIEANIRLSMHLFRAAATRGVKVVNALSYFQFRHGSPSAHSLYSATKQAQAEFSRYWREKAGADIRDVVLFDNYGVGDDRDKLVPALIRTVRERQTLTVGPREQPMDLLHVRDVASGLIATASGASLGPLAVRARETVTVGAIIDLVGRLAGETVRATVDPARTISDQPVIAGSWPRPAGWSPMVELEEGIAECLAARG